jgi:hypothetical protein
VDTLQLVRHKPSVCNGLCPPGATSAAEKNAAKTSRATVLRSSLSLVVGTAEQLKQLQPAYSVWL